MLTFPIFTRTQTAETVPFDGQGSGLVSTNISDAIKELANAGSGAGSYQFEYLELTERDIQAKSVFLSRMPSATGALRFDYVIVTPSAAEQKKIVLSKTPDGPIFLDVVGGTVQHEGLDFILSGQEITWDGLGLDGLLEPGDVLRIMQPPSTLISLDVVGGTLQEAGVDFTVNGQQISWDGLGLDGLLEAQDILRVLYPTDAIIKFHRFTALEIKAGSFELDSAPTSPGEVIMDIVGGAPQYVGLDFSVVGSKIEFSGFPLQTLIEPGDVARIIYHKN